MKVADTRTITVMGAGLAGTLMSVLLARRGFHVELFERNPDPRAGGGAAGRSINLALAERGKHALRMAGLMDQVDQYTLPMRGRMLHDLQGNQVLQPYGAAEHEVIWSVHRRLLNQTLLNAAEATGQVRMHFDHQLSRVDWDTRTLHFADASSESFEVMIGADGGGSAVRRAMQQVTDLGVSEELLDHGYRELTIPAGADGEFQLAPDALHIWPRGGFMLIALPNSDKSFTVTLFLANQGNPSFAQLDDWPAQREFCAEQFPDIFDKLSHLREDFEENPVGLLGTIRCKKWHNGSRCVLLGDAAHAVVPFHGQGMNAAFEDCAALASLLEDRDQHWEDVFARFQDERVSNANAIADMALENYIIMRESVRNPAFLLRKALEHELERRFGDRFVARYSLVMFHRIPYREAFQRGQIQAQILDQLLAGISSLEDVDFQAAEQLVSQKLDLLADDMP